MIRRAFATTLLVLFASSVTGCGGKAPTPEEKAAIAKTLQSVYKARDRAIEIKVNSIRMDGDEAKVVMTVLYPKFASFGLKHDVVMRRSGVKWEIVSDKQRSPH